MVAGDSSSLFCQPAAQLTPDGHRRYTAPITDRQTRMTSTANAQNRQSGPAGWWLLAATAAASVLLAMLTFRQPGAPLSPGLDSSWAYGLNYAYQQGLVMGQDILFTFGPLGFLEHTRALTTGMLQLSGWFWFVVTAITAGMLLQLARASAISRWHLAANLLVAIALFIYLDTNIDRLLVIVYAGVFLHWQTRHAAVLYLLALASVLALLIKFSYGAVALSLFLPYLAALALRDRRWQAAMAGLVALPLFCTAIWLGIYGSLDGLAGYFHGGLEFSRGSTTAMALNPENHWPGIIFFWSAFVFGLWLIGRDYRRDWVWMPLCFLGPLFIWNKYAFGREDDAHLAFLMIFVFQLGLICTIAATSWEHKLSCLLAIVLSYVTWQDMHTPAIGKPQFQPTVAVDSGKWWHWPQDHEGLAQLMADASERELAPLLIPGTLRDTIGNATVDIYPWETLIAAANQLNWTPRPVYQAYITYTPFLDRQNADFLASDKAPSFIVWHYHSFADIDDRYPFSSDPLTLTAILRHYRLQGCEGKFCLWQRAEREQLAVVDNSARDSTRWEQWIPVPDLAGDVLRLHVDSQRTLAGKLNLALWKEGGIEIDYRLRDGKVKTHTLILDNATSGIWVTPYLDSLVTPNKPQPLAVADVQALLALPPAKGFIEDSELTAEGLRIWGWGIVPFMPSATQRLGLLLYNDSHAYLVPVENRPRPGITDFFTGQGAFADRTAVDLDSCGFNEKFNHRDLVPGEYRVRFVVENGDQRAVSEEQNKTVAVTHDSNPHNVEAVRLRTIRPWAFNDTLDIRWSSLEFAGEHPW